MSAQEAAEFRPSQVYRLSRHVTLSSEGGRFMASAGGRIFGLSSRAFTILSLLDGVLSVENVTECLGLDGAEVARILDGAELSGLAELNRDATNTLPRISIVIPVRNRSDQLAECLSSLEVLNYPEDLLEVVIVDDGSDPPVRIETRRMKAKIVRCEDGLGPARARNRGVEFSSGEVIAFTDSDCLADPDWLGDLISLMGGSSAVGGLVTHRESSALNRYEAVRSPVQLGALNRRIGTEGEFSYLPTCNLLVWRDRFDEAGGFDPSLPIGEDVDLVWRLAGRGPVRYRTKGRIVHNPPSTLKGFVKRHVLYGLSVPLLLKKHPGRRNTIRLGLIGMVLMAFTLLMAHTGEVALAYPILGSLLAGWMIPWLLLRSQSLPKDGSITSAARGFLYSLLNTLRTISRNYSLILLPLAAAFSPRIAIAMGLWGCALILAEWVKLRPRLDPVRFAALYVLEDLSYQVGQLYGCVRKGILKPLVPRIRFVKIH